MIAARTIATWLLAVPLAAVFAYAGAGKLADPAGFATSIANYRILPPPATEWLAHYLPWLEVVAALSLLIPQMRQAAAMLIGSLLAVFIAALISAQLRGLDLTCGCFSGGESSTAFATARNFALFGIAGAIVVIERSGVTSR